MIHLRLDVEIRSAKTRGYPFQRSRMRYDILQFAQAQRIREMIADAEGKFVFVRDGDYGLKAAFTSAVADLVKQERADIALIFFAKKMTLDARSAVWAAGRSLLAGQTGLTISQLDELSIEGHADRVDAEIASSIIRQCLAHGFSWPYHTKSEPDRRIQLITDRPGLSARSAARL